MDGKKNKIIFLLSAVLLFLSCLSDCRVQKKRHASDIEIELTSLQGEPLLQAGVGVPFLIKVMVSDDNGRIGEPRIQGVFAQRTGIHIQSINGFSTTTYTYKALINQPGEYEIGPAVVETNQGSLESDIVKISVVEQETVEGRVGKKNSHAQKQVFAELWAEESDVYVNQSINLVLRCYFLNNVALKSLIKPNVPWLDLVDNGSASEGTEYKGSTLYHYVEWRWNAYPTQAGSFIIPAFGIQAEIDMHTRNTGLFSHMPLFFAGMMNEQVQVHSNGVSITVQSLPVEIEKTGLVGDFSALKMEVDPVHIKQGQAAVLKLTLKGRSGVDRVQKPSLMNMPDSMRWYYSKDESIKYRDGENAKQWEFVLQPLDAGVIEIPEQRIVYFDTALEKVRVLQTDKIILSVEASSVAVQVPHQETVTTPLADTNLNAREPMHVWYDAWQPTHTRTPFSWYTFFIMCIAIWSFFLYQTGSRWIRSFFLRSSFLMKNKVFLQAYFALKNAQRNNHAYKVYYIFDVLFKQQGWSAHTDSYAHTVVPFFKTEKDQKEWKIFMEEVVRYAFDGEHRSQGTSLFFRQAYQWLYYIKRHF